MVHVLLSKNEFANEGLYILGFVLTLASVHWCRQVIIASRS